MEIVTLTNANFTDEVEKAQVPVLVDFWAAWCGPCRMISPLVDRLATEFGERLKVGKINVDEQMELAQRFSVMSIPMMALFKNGELVDQVIGADPAGLRAMVEKNV